MASVASYDDIVNRAGGLYYATQPIWGQRTATTTAAITGTGTGTGQRCGDTAALPSLPAGVTAYIPTSVSLGSTTANVGLLLAKVVNLGTFDISNTTAGMFTDGSAMPTATIFNNAATSYSGAVLVECTTATTGTQTLVTVTYKNQSGTGAQTTTFTPVTSAVVGSVSHLILGGTDWGVQDITAVSRSASSGPTGVLKFWGVIPISFIGSITASAHETDNLLTGGVNLIRLSASDTFSAFNFGSTAAKAVFGHMYYIGDS